MKKQIYKIIKNKAGVTLVELIIGIAMIGIISLSVSLVFVPTLNMFTSIKEKSEVGSVVNTLGNKISDDLSKAVVSPDIDISGKEIEITTPEGIVTYNLDTNGYLNRNGKYVLEKYYYKNKSVDITYEKAVIPDKNQFESYNIIISVLDADKKSIIRRTYLVMPLLLEKNQYN